MNKKSLKLDKKIWKKNRKIIIRGKLVINQLILYLSPYLMRFVVVFTEHSYFHFMESLTIGFAMGKAEFKDTNVIIGLFE